MMQCYSNRGNATQVVQVSLTVTMLMQSEPLEVVIAECQKHCELVDGILIRCEQSLSDLGVPRILLDTLRATHHAVFASEYKPEEPLSNHPIQLHYT